ncbi:MAG: dephospho-CoA kinase [Leptonema sp. (in: bacteria)]
MNSQKFPISLGLTGTLGSGKSTIANILKNKNFFVVDTDQVAKNLYALPKNKKKLIDKWGRECFYENGQLNSKFLAEKVFSNREDLQWLEELIHPQVENFIRKYLKRCKSRFIVFEVPLLFESKLDKKNLFDYIIVVDASVAIRKKRVLENRYWTEEAFWKRENMQMNPNEKRKKADFIIENENDLDKLQKQLDDLITKIDSGGNI